MVSQFMLPVSAESSTQRFFLCLVALFSISAIAVAGQNNAMNSPSNSGVWSGILVSSGCNADEAFNESPECNKDVPGAKLALYDDTNRVVYSLQPQRDVNAHLGDTVTVRGTLDGETIQLTSIQSMSIGLAVGQKAPAFSVPDQFGRMQSLDSLKGKNGTVLLFYRSADW